MLTKLKFFLCISMMCAVAYICLIHITCSLGMVCRVPSPVLKFIPQTGRNLYNNSRISENLGVIGSRDQPPNIFSPPTSKLAWNRTHKPVTNEQSTPKAESSTEKVEQKDTDLPRAYTNSSKDNKFAETAGPSTYEPEGTVVNESPHAPMLSGMSFKEALSTVTSDKTVLLTLVDLAFHAMAVNFYLTCLKPFGIRNYIILTMHPNTCKILQKYQINCFFYRDFSGAETASNYGTQVFKDKMNVRTDFILDAMRLNYSVLHTDIDMYCFKNVITSAYCPRESCDISPLMDMSAYNAGFLFINPSSASINVYEYMKVIAKSRPGVDDQAQLNQAMRRQSNQTGGLKVKKLPEAQFQCGVTFYENPKRFFADTAKPCAKCVVVHNNWIVSMEAKVYRAKEMHHWMYDGDNGGYYTSVDAKYLRYKNTLGDENQVNALKSALAIATILNRTLILPTFPGNPPNPLNAVLMLTPFDQEFEYREHSFSTHPLVPESVKTSVSPLFVIASRVIVDRSPDVLHEEGIKVVTPKDPKSGMSDQEIIDHFQNVKESILEIHSLYDAFSSFTDAAQQAKWVERCQNGMKGAEYRQYVLKREMNKKHVKKGASEMYMYAVNTNM